MTNLSLDDPLFFSKLRAMTGGTDEVFERIILSGLQEGSSYLALKRAIAWSEVLVDEKGVIDAAKLPPLIKVFEKDLFLAGQESGSEKNLFQLRALKKLLQRKDLLKLLGTVDAPYREPLGEKWIRLTLGLKKGDAIQKREAVKAVLSAWFMPLRQNVGSCFATAPAIEIQEDHPEYLIRDLKDLLETGRLKRVIGGVEHMAPLVATMGFGSLKAAAPFELSKWMVSPGLERAFQALNVPLSILKNLFPNESPRYLSIDEVLQWALRTTLGLQPREIEEFLNRRMTEPLPSLLIRQGSGGQGKKVAEYLEKLEAARMAFILMTEHPLLKAWEYTLASFAETKGDFASWNLYSSLGFPAEEEGGIGRILLQTIQQALNETNKKMLDLQEEYKMVYLQLSSVESRLKVASSEKELNWIRVDYQAKKNEYNTLEMLRDRENAKAGKLANLPNLISNHFIDLFPKYFQEVYDPDLVEVKVGPFDDAPAGFRLLYKHGRQSVSAWTMIKNADEFVDTLASFFQSTEREFSEEEIKGVEKEVSDAITAVCLHVRTKEFLVSAFYRMAKAHQTPMIADPLNNLDKIEKKPWAFTSGGTMKGLVASYFSLQEPPLDLERWVENPEELLVFLVDEVKKLPTTTLKLFEERPEKGILMHSPTHAFRLLPSIYPFSEAWKEDVFTYTWVRDRLINPQKDFYKKISFDAHSFEKMKEAVANLLPQHLQPLFKKQLQPLSSWISIPYFRDMVYDVMKEQPSIYQAISLDVIDSLFFESLPLISLNEFWELAESFLQQLKLPLKGNFSNLELPSILTRKEAREALTALTSLTVGKSKLPLDLAESAVLFLREKGKEPPPSILFADTNWEEGYFAFQVNPGTDQLELWKTNRLGTTGSPMSYWRHWLDGSRRSPTWGIHPTLSTFL